MSDANEERGDSATEFTENFIGERNDGYSDDNDFDYDHRHHSHYNNDDKDVERRMTMNMQNRKIALISFTESMSTPHNLKG